MELSKETVDGLFDRIGIKGIADKLLPLPEGVFDLSPDNPKLKDHIVMVYPRTLEDVRLLVGTTLADGKKNRENMNIPEQMASACEMALDSNLWEVDSVDNETLYHIANQILHFPSEETEELLGNNGLYQKARDKILDIAKAVPVLAAQELVVKNGENYCISVHTAVFNSITIYGSGHITFATDQVKLVTNTFKYEPNSKGED